MELSQGTSPGALLHFARGFGLSTEKGIHTQAYLLEQNAVPQPTSIR